MMSDQEEYEVESILGKRMKRGKVQYLVKWKGWDRPEHNSWEPIKNLHCNDLIEDFEAAAAAKTKAKNKPREAEEQKRKKVDVDIRRKRKVIPGPKLKKTVSLGFGRGLTAEKIIGITSHPADGELYHLVKVSRLSSLISILAYLEYFNLCHLKLLEDT